MSPFFRDARHHLTIDGVPLDRLMTEFGSPLYAYSGAGLQRAFTAFQTAVAPVSGKLHFALKANSALGVIALLARCGAGADIVSAGELARALAAGIAAGDIVFSGVGKSAGYPRRAYRGRWSDQCRIAGRSGANQCRCGGHGGCRAGCFAGQCRC